jgi:hypothetical protein
MAVQRSVICARARTAAGTASSLLLQQQPALQPVQQAAAAAAWKATLVMVSGNKDSLS